MARIKSQLNLELVEHYKDSRGRARVKGGKDLKESATYPIRLGQEAGPYSFQAISCQVGSILSAYVNLGSGLLEFLIFAYNPV